MPTDCTARWTQDQHQRQELCELGQHLLNVEQALRDEAGSGEVGGAQYRGNEADWEELRAAANRDQYCDQYSRGLYDEWEEPIREEWNKEEEREGGVSITVQNGWGKWDDRDDQWLHELQGRRETHRVLDGAAI